MDTVAAEKSGIGALTGPARQAARALATSTTARRNDALMAAAAALRARQAEILAANAQDVAASTASAAFRDRLTLNPARVEAMAKGLEEIAALPDPLGHVLAEWTRPNGLLMRRVAVPIGVIGMIYESRPNVGADAAGLCIKSGNAVILRGGSESLHSARAIQACIEDGLRAAGLPVACVQIAPDADRAHVGAMLTAVGAIDLIIPRGGNRWSSAFCVRRACRFLRMRRGFATPMFTPPPIRTWRAGFWRMPRCGAPASAVRRRRC